VAETKVVLLNFALQREATSKGEKMSKRNSMAGSPVTTKSKEI
jgi:hypothetical protein